MAIERVEQRFDIVVASRHYRHHARRGSRRWDDPRRPITLAQLIEGDSFMLSTSAEEHGNTLGTQEDTEVSDRNSNRMPSDWPPPFGLVFAFKTLLDKAA